MSVETIPYMGLPNCLRVSNGSVELIATTDVGPRILHYGFAGGENLLAEFPDLAKRTALGDWKPYGGHRLWIWPEVFPATYAPDDGPIEHKVEGELGLTVRQPVDAAHMQKEIRLTVSPSGTAVRLEQTVTNHNMWPVDIAAWAITVVRSGTAIVPRVPFQSHDECVAVAQPIAIWAFTDLQDPRFTLGSRYILLGADPELPSPQKFGLRNKQGWCAHLVDNTLYVKRFAHDESTEYPDYGVNNEVYVEGSYMELELLGPRRIVPAGNSLTLIEEWHLFKNIEVSTGERNMERLHQAIKPKIESLF
jgi:hypothetical protein